MSRRRAAVLIGVHVLVALHIVHWWLRGTTLSPLEPSEAMELGKHGVINAGLIFFAAMILLTAFLGRFFCGWGCHLVALQDLSRSLLVRMGIRPKPLRSRLLKLVPAVAFFYMFLWPAVWGPWRGHARAPARVELTTSSFWATFPGWAVALLTFLVCGFAVIYFLGAKGFCTYACPYGAIFGVADRLAPVRIRVTDACEGCGHCTATCSSNVRVHEEVATYGMVVDPGCMKCMDCVSVCPNDALYLGAGRPSLLARPREGAGLRKHRLLPWDEEICLGAAFLAAFLVTRGLYGIFPFLFSLGWSAIVAYLALLTYRLGRRQHVRLRSWALKQWGRLRAPGHVFLGAMLLLGAVGGHSALVQYHHWRGRQLYDATGPRRGALLELRPGKAVEGDPGAVAAAMAHLRWVRERGILPTPGVDRMLAWLHLVEGSEEGYRRHAAAALEQAPGDAGLRLELGHLHFRRGEDREAARLYRQALAVGPAPEAAVNLSLILTRAGDLPAASEVLDRGIATSPRVPELHYNRALVAVAREDPDEALAAFHRALEIDPAFRQARENLAGLLCSLGRYGEGIGHYRRALEEEPGDLATRVLLARAYAADGQLARAQVELSRVLALDPSLPAARRLLRDLERSG